jgi:hypothetical protein
MGHYFVPLKRHEIDPPTHDTMRIPTAISLVPQSKSLKSPLGPEPGAQYGVCPNVQLGASVSVV